MKYEYIIIYIFTKHAHSHFFFNNEFIQTLIFRIFEYTQRPYFRILEIFCTTQNSQRILCCYRSLFISSTRESQEFENTYTNSKNLN